MSTDQSGPLGPFMVHAEECARCRLFVPEKPATLALVCLQGAPLLKDGLAALYHQAKRAHSAKAPA